MSSTLDLLNITPTLSQFLGLPYYTKITQQFALDFIWNYIYQRKLFIDFRTLILDSSLKSLFFPAFLNETYPCISLEHRYIIVYDRLCIHFTEQYIQQDVNFRLELIKKNLAAYTIQRFFVKYCQNLHDTLWKPPESKMMKRTWELLQNDNSDK